MKIRVFLVAAALALSLAACKHAEPKHEKLPDSGEVVSKVQTAGKPNDGNKLEIFEAEDLITGETTEREPFVTPNDWEGVQCRQYWEDEKNTDAQECTFPNANMRQVYGIVKK